MPRSYLLTTRGRKTGRPRTNPVVPVEHDRRRWLVAPYGPVSWVHNAIGGVPPAEFEAAYHAPIQPPPEAGPSN